MADSRHTRKGKGRPSKAILLNQQQVIVRIDRTKYRKMRQILLSMDLTVSSLIRDMFDKFLKEHEKN